MSIIDDLKQSISSMSDQELMDLTLEVRKNRRTIKLKKKKKSSIVDLNTIAKALNPSAAAALLILIEGRKKK